MINFSVKHALWLTLAAGVFISFIFLSYLGFQTQELDQLQRRSSNQLNLFISHVEGYLARYEYLPELVASHPQILALLNTPRVDHQTAGNSLLETIAEVSGALDIYVMDQKGNTLAASNWKLPRSFAGQNFSFRPYFQQALRGQTGRYFALGTTSGQRGYYFSYPIVLEESLLGVVAVKLDVSDIELTWSGLEDRFIVTDHNGIVFLSTYQSWRYRSLLPLSEQVLATIQRDRQYVDTVIEPLPMKLDYRLNARSQLVRFAATEQPEQPTAATYLMASQVMDEAGWTVHILSDTQLLDRQIVLQTALTAVALVAFILLLTLYWVNHKRRQALQFARDELESRVVQRTAALSREIDERRKTERELRQTQAELIHTAKMAGLGQLSAGISHELNQPLTAIRSYADNAQKLLQRGRHQALADNLVQINELTEKMAAIITLLRGFSRKSRGETRCVVVDQVIQEALNLFKQDIQRDRIDITITAEPGLTISTDPLLLNQVLVNLISNAVHAVAASSKKHIQISVTDTDDSSACILSVSDNGPGISDELMDQLFDPFFTTKEVGLGLGLGLSISYRIMQILGGDIKAVNNSKGGAEFRLTLPYSATG